MSELDVIAPLTFAVEARNARGETVITFEPIKLEPGESVYLPGGLYLAYPAEGLKIEVTR